MKLAFKLAYRNLVGAGLRTWLNVIVLSFAFVMIIWAKGILLGWDQQAKRDMTEWEISGGQYWHEAYDPYDQFTLADAHAPVPHEFLGAVEQGSMVPVLITQGTLFPQGRMQSVMIKGIDPAQKLLKLPSHMLDSVVGAIPAIIGSSMARSAALDTGDYVTLRWRDADGTFDAAEIAVKAIFKTNVPTVDVGQVWIPLAKLQEMMLMPGEATVITFSQGSEAALTPAGWKLMTFGDLTSDIEEMIKTKSTGQAIFYLMLILLAMLAIFDTQILSIFRRQKEIGTYVALGYTRTEVVGLFTLEGAIHALLAATLAAAYGIPFLLWQARTGLTLPIDSAEYGFAIADVMYPVYTVGLVATTIFLVFVTTAVVSYLPSRKIARMNPTEALRGRLQ
jgi:ABC-type lipoprotein release transport system permease subunit